MKTIGEITSALMGNYQLNDVLMMVLEGMYRGVGSQHVLLALVNPQRTHLTYRFGLGPNTDAIRPVLHLPLNLSSGLPAQCITEAREIYVADMAANGRRGLLPAELAALLHAKSVLLLPIVIRDLPIGLFLLDRGPDQMMITKQDLHNLRTLSGQAVLAIKQCQAARR
jgi:GAF domain-containing protein